MVSCNLYFKKLKIYLLFLLFILSFIETKSQNEYEPAPEEDISQYFQDSGYSRRKNVVKVNLLSLLQGDLPISFERVLTKAITIEAGIGIMFPYYVPGSFELFLGEERVIKKPNMGYSLMLQPKLYLRVKKAPEYSYLSLLYRRRVFSQNNAKITFDEFAFTFGFQLFVGKSNQIVTTYESGFGLRIAKDYSQNSKKYSPIAPLNLKLGYIF